MCVCCKCWKYNYCYIAYNICSNLFKEPWSLEGILEDYLAFTIYTTTITSMTAISTTTTTIIATTTATSTTTASTALPLFAQVHTTYEVSTTVSRCGVCGGSVGIYVLSTSTLLKRALPPCTLCCFARIPSCGVLLYSTMSLTRQPTCPLWISSWTWPGLCKTLKCAGTTASGPSGARVTHPCQVRDCMWGWWWWWCCPPDCPSCHFPQAVSLLCFCLPMDRL